FSCNSIRPCASLLCDVKYSVNSLILMISPSTTSKPATAITWTAAVLTSALGAAILYAAWPGINWPIWVAAACLSLIVSRLVSAHRVETPLIILVVWATLLSIGFALTANDFIQVLIVVRDAMLLGLAKIGRASCR